MSIETELRAWLLADTTIAGLIDTRMYPQYLPQKVTYPAISYATASRVSSRQLSGPAGRARPRITVNSWAETYLEAKALAEAVRKRLDGFAGRWGSFSVGSVALDNAFDQYESEAEAHRIFQDYIVSHIEQ